MKASELIKDIGRQGFYQIDFFDILVVIKDVIIDEKYGDIRYLIKPVAGLGENVVSSVAIRFPTSEVI